MKIVQKKMFLLQLSRLNVSFLFFGVFTLLFGGCTQKYMTRPDGFSKTWVCPPNKPHHLKKITIVYNQSGAGHVAASRALAQLLQNDYCLSFVNFSQDVIAKAFFISSPDLDYNAMVSERRYKRLDWYAKKFLPWAIKTFGGRMRKFFRAYVREQKPDLIISTIPLVDGLVVDVANNFRLPSLVISLDLALSNWLLNFNKENIDLDRVHFTYGPISDSEYQRLLQTGIALEHTHNIGFPIRNNFKAPYNKQKSRALLNIPHDAFTIMVMMGGSGTNFMCEIGEELAKIKNDKRHLIFVTGRNEELKKKLELLTWPENITVSVLGFVEDIALLMSASDVLITKGGPGTIYEAIHMHLPLVIDMTSGAMAHELLAANYVKDLKIGSLMQSLDQLNPIIKEIASKNQNEINKAFSAIVKKDFNSELKLLVAKLLKEHSG